MKKCLILILFALFSFNLVNAEIRINEIMYNPEGLDNNKEFIEIFSDETLNLTDYTIEDLASSDTLELVKYVESNYALIVEEGFDYSDIDCSVYSTGATIGNNLNNEFDVILLRDTGGNLIDGIKYYPSWGGDNNGYSLEFVDNNWIESSSIGGSPGEENQISRSSDFLRIKINEFLPNPFGDDNAPMPEGEFIELYNSGEKEVDLEGMVFYDSANHKLIISGTNVLKGTIISQNSYLTVYTNGISGFLNNDNLEEIKLYNNNNLIDQVSYSFSDEGLSWSKMDDLWQLNLPTPNQENKVEGGFEESNLEIQNIYLGTDNKAKFGDNLRIKVSIYRGNTGKYSVQLWIEDKSGNEISKKTRFNAEEKYREYELTLPVQIAPNCKQKYKDGEYKVILSGLDGEVKENIDIEGIDTSLCEKQESQEEKKKEFDVALIDFPVQLFGNELKFKINIENNLPEPKNVKVWSYVYRGSKSYSGDREANIKEIKIEPNTNKEVELVNELDEITSTGSYKTKLKVLREDRKTPTELTQEFMFLAIPNTQTTSETNINNTTNELTGNIIYEASNFKAKRLGLYFFNAILLLLLIEIIRRK